MKCFANSYTYRLNGDVPDCLKEIFPDSVIAKNLSFGRAKTMYVANEGITTDSKKMLHIEVKMTECFVAASD